MSVLGGQAMQADKALRGDVTRAYETAWQVQVLSEPTRTAVKEGDLQAQRRHRKILILQSQRS